MLIKNNKGFTLLELIIAMAISALLLSGIYNILIASNKNFNSQANITDMHQSARMSLELMAREMKQISSITAIDCTADSSSITFNAFQEWGTATSGGTATLIDTTKSWTANEWQNNAVTIVAGAGEDDLRTVSSNTSTQLTVSTDWTTTPDATTLYGLLINKAYSRDTMDNELDYTDGNGAGVVFAENITSLTLQGYDSAAAATCAAADITRIEISVTARTVKTDPNYDDRYHYYTGKTQIRLRN